MIKNILKVVTLGILATSTTWAETDDTKRNESKDWSARLSFGIAPGWDEIVRDIQWFPESQETESLSGDGAPRIEVLLEKRFFAGESSFGGMLGGGFFFTDQTFTGGSLADSDVINKIKTTAVGGILHGGAVARAGKNIVFELGPYVGYGTAYNDGASEVEEWEPYVFWGIKGGVFFLISKSAEIGLEVGYEEVSSSGADRMMDYDWGWNFATDFYDYDLTGSGIRVAGVLSLRF